LVTVVIGYEKGRKELHHSTGTVQEQHTIISITNAEGQLQYVIAKNQDDYEKKRKYAVVIRKFQRRLNIAISDFPEIGIYGFEEDFENKEEDDDSKLAVYDPWTRERIEDAREDEDEDDEDKEDEDDNSYYRCLYRR
jgi:hypothetical protein